MARQTKTPIDPDDAPLKRLGAGRWQTRDERFTIEPQSGTWVIVDAEQTDDFGMALVRGPFPSLTAAKEAISTARASAPATSPLAARIERRGRQPAAGPEPAPRAKRSGPAERTDATGEGTSAPGAAPKVAAKAVPRVDEPATRRAQGPVRGRSGPVPNVDEQREPAWLDDLGATERGRARRLIARLRADGVSDAEGLVRRDLVGDVPALAAHALASRLATLRPDAPLAEVAELLADGRDAGLGVRWRLVDGNGRQILLDPSARRRR